MHTLTQVPMHSLCVCISVCVVLSSYRYYLRCFIYVSQLEALNISYTIEAFLSSPKEGMVKGLWKNHSHEPQVPTRKYKGLGLLDYGKIIIIPIILLNVEIPIIQTIIFEFENMMYLFSMSLPINTL